MSGLKSDWVSFSFVIFRLFWFSLKNFNKTQNPEQISLWKKIYTGEKYIFSFLTDLVHARAAQAIAGRIYWSTRGGWHQKSRNSYFFLFFFSPGHCLRRQHSWHVFEKIYKRTKLASKYECNGIAKVAKIHCSCSGTFSEQRIHFLCSYICLYK